MQKLSDYVIEFIVKLGVKHVFMVPGGGAMHLNDSLGLRPEIESIGNLHEQASAMAAETYAKMTENIGVALVTTGPGGTNTVTGVAGAWLDSTPCLFVSGQAKRPDLKGNSGIRQGGVQEVDIVSIISPITKYAVTVMEPETIRYHLERAMHIATRGRPGPVWVDIPLDVQAAEIDPSKLQGFTAEEPSVTLDESRLKEQVARAIELFNASERPVILVGNGLRLAHAQTDFRELQQRLQSPVLATWLAADLFAEKEEFFIGRPGGVAPRGVNFALQNSDFLLSIGSRIDNTITGYAPDRFARGAKKVMVDVDASELRKLEKYLEMSVCTDALAFIREFLAQTGKLVPRNRTAWINRCQKWKHAYPVVQPEHRNPDQLVSTYYFSEILSEELKENDLIVPGSSGAGIEILQLAFKLKRGQRLFQTSALGSMGNGLPSAIGACLGGDRRETMCG